MGPLSHMSGILQRRWPCEDTEIDTERMPCEDDGRDQGDTAEDKERGRLPANPRRGETSKRFLPHSPQKEPSMKIP